MNADQRLLDDRDAVWFPYREKASSEIIRFLPLFVPILGGLFALVIALFMPTDPGSLSRWWAFAFAMIPTALILLPIWIIGTQNFRHTVLGVTPEGFIYKVPDIVSSREAHIRFSDVTTFARTHPEEEIQLHSYAVDSQNVSPAGQQDSPLEAQVIVANCWVHRGHSSRLARLFSKPSITRKNGVWFRPSAFDENWRHGQIGLRLAQNRPDLFIPLEGSPLPWAYNPAPREWD